MNDGMAHTSYTIMAFMKTTQKRTELRFDQELFANKNSESA